MKTYMDEDSGEERPERRSRDRSLDDARIGHLFYGFDMVILNGDQYTQGYVWAMRKEFAELVETLVTQRAEAPVVPDGWASKDGHWVRAEDKKNRPDADEYSIAIYIVQPTPAMPNLSHKPTVQRLMDLARRFRSTPGDLYDGAYKELERACYEALSAVPDDVLRQFVKHNEELFAAYRARTAVPAVRPLATANRYCAAGMCLQKDKHEAGCTAHGIAEGGHV